VHDAKLYSSTSIIIITTDSMIPAFIPANIWDRDRDEDRRKEGHRMILQYNTGIIIEI